MEHSGLWENNKHYQFSSVQLLSCVRLFATPWTAAHQASLSITNSPSLVKLVKVHQGFPGDSDSKESACNARDLGLIPVLGTSPGGGHGNPLQYSCLENPHRQRSLVGYSPWDHKESDMTE